MFVTANGLLVSMMLTTAYKLQYLQWIEIQAHKMKMKPQEIKILAEKKQAELCDLLKVCYILYNILQV